MDLLQLRYFFESAQTESFAKTAKKYGVPATSVSASVKRLENELKCRLFDRTGNRIMLNDKGRSFLQSLHTVFHELDSAVENLSAVNIDTREIKMLVRAVRGDITDYIIEYKTKHPDISFKTVFDFNDVDFENYDIIIDEKNNAYSEYEKLELYTTRIRLSANSSNPLCKKKLSLKQLSDQPFISIGEQNSMHKIFLNACKRAGFIPNIVVQSNDLQCNRKCVEAGVGIGLSREYPHKEPTGNTAYLDVSDFNEKQTICCYYKKQSNYGNVQHFLNFLRSKSY